MRAFCFLSTKAIMLSKRTKFFDRCPEFEFSKSSCAAIHAIFIEIIKVVSNTIHSFTIFFQNCNKRATIKFIVEFGIHVMCYFRLLGNCKIILLYHSQQSHSFIICICIASKAFYIQYMLFSFFFSSLFTCILFCLKKK